MTHRISATLFAVVVFLSGSASLHAQHYNFKFYGQDEGLRNLAVQAILQDREGFLWVGTQNGLFRYDGSTFKAFTKADGLAGVRIESLHEAADGTLWVGTRIGLARRKGERFETVPLDGGAQGVTGPESIASDPQGRLYLASDRGLLAGTSLAGTMKGTALSFTPVNSSIEPAEAASVYLDRSGRLWFGCGLDLCILESGKAHATGRESGLPAERWDAILEDPNGDMWVRSQASLYMRPRGSDRFRSEPGLAVAEGAYAALALDSVGRLLAPTADGLARRTARGWEAVAVEDGLGPSGITTAFRDREGNIWLGLVGSGLARWLGYNEWQSWGKGEGLSRSSVSSIASDLGDPGGTLFAGTQDGLDIAKVQDGILVWKHKPIPGINAVRAAIAGPDGTLWMAGDDPGLMRLDSRSARPQFIGAAQGLAGIVQHLRLDHQGQLWASTTEGLYRTVAGKTPARFTQVVRSSSNSAERFSMTAEDRTGGVWAAGDFGLARIADSQWVHYTVADGLKSNLIAQVAADADGSVWIGYRDALGITHLSLNEAGRPTKVEHFNTGNNALRSDRTNFLGLDRRGWLWVGTDHGVDVFDRARWRHFGRSEGLIWDACNTNAFLATEDGAVWIGTTRGLSRFEPQPVPPPSIPPHVVFTSVTVGGTQLPPDREVAIPWNRRPLQVRFSALTYTNEAAVLFRYRLGADGPWQETTERELNFAALPTHNFTLEVMARNGHGVWSATPARLSFPVQAPWWESAWFAGAMVLLLVVLARMILWRRTRRLVAERGTLEEAVFERTHALASEKLRAEHEKAVVDQQKQEIERLLDQTKEISRHKSEFLANMSHEIRTPMNGVLGMTNLVLATQLDEEQREYVETARLSADFLLTVLNDILDFSKIEAGRLDLNPIDFSLKDCVDQVGRMLSLQIANKKLEYSLSVAPDVPDRLVGDPDRLRQILLNLVGNAIKFTDQGGISVSVQCESTPGAAADGNAATLLFSVHDSGVGIPADKQGVIFDAFRQADGSTTRKYGGTGLGLAICSRLVDMMGGSIRVESEVGRGSTFHFSARLGVVTETAAEIDEQARKLALVAPAANELWTKLRILLAEDNPVNQRLASKVLEKRGHQITVTATGRGAFERIRDERFDVVLMDVQMPDMDGLEATALIREWEKARGRRTPIIALTAHSMKGDRDRCLAAGMDTYVTKPFDAARLIEVVESTAREVGARPVCG